MQTLKNLGSTRLYAMVGVGIILLAVFAFLSLRISGATMAPLYSNLAPEEGAKIIQELDLQNIPYEIQANGTQILVPSDKVLKLRLSLAGKGMPSQGSVVGYEIFNESESLGTSNFIHDVNLLRALEGELSRTIVSMEPVQAARVHIVMPRRELFEREQKEASASVVLTLRNKNDTPSREQIQAVANLVATAVPNLKISRITITDSRGKLLQRGGDDKDDMGAVASNAEEFRVAYEKRLQRDLQQLVEQSIGEGKAKIEVSADIDFDRVITNDEIYNPEGQVPRSVQTTEENSNNQDKGPADVSVKNNVPDGAPQTGPASQSSTKRTEEITNFEISKTVRNHVKETGTVKRLSVAVLVDGNYKQPTEEGQSTIYEPRPAEEIKQIEDLVKSAVGFDENRGDKISVINMQFNREPEVLEKEKPFEWLKRDLDSILKTFVIGLVAVLVILLVIKPLVNRAFEIAPAEYDEEGKPVLPGVEQKPRLIEITEQEEEQFDMELLQKKGGSDVVRRINQIAGTNPDEVLAAIRGWLTLKSGG